MIIKQGLPNFENKKCLIAVVSNHRLTAYFAGNRRISQVDDYYVETPRYTDNEGYFGVYRRGAVYEDKHEFRSQYAQSLAKRLIEIANSHKPQHVCLFIAENFKNEVMKHLPHEIRKLIFMEFFGNYCERHPFEYLQIIQEKLAEEKNKKIVKPIKPEAKKIMDVEIRKLNE